MSLLEIDEIAPYCYGKHYNGKNMTHLCAKCLWRDECKIIIETQVRRNTRGKS